MELNTGMTSTKNFAVDFGEFFENSEREKFFQLECCVLLAEVQ